MEQWLYILLEMKIIKPILLAVMIGAWYVLLKPIIFLFLVGFRLVSLILTTTIWILRMLWDFKLHSFPGDIDTWLGWHYEDFDMPHIYYYKRIWHFLYKHVDVCTSKTHTFVLFYPIRDDIRSNKMD